MARSFWPLLAIVSLLAGGCLPAPVPPDQAQVKLSNTRTERINGEDHYKIDFQFTRGRPAKGKLYRLILISGSDQKYWIDEYFTEKKIKGTIEGKMSFRDARWEPSKYFEVHLEMLVGTSDWKTISNQVTFGTPTAEDVIGGDGEPDPPSRPQNAPATPRPLEALPPVAQASPVPAATPDVPMPSVGIGPRGFLGSRPAPPATQLPDAPPATTDRANAQPTNIPPAPANAAAPSVTGKDTRLAGGKGGVPFRADDAEGRTVIGFRFSSGMWAGQEALRSLEPLYDRSTLAGPNVALARDGYAVGGLQVDAAQYVHAVQIVFMRVKPDGKLDSADSYASDWLGTRTDASPTAIDGGGAPVLGIHGRRAAILDAVGLVLQQH